MLTTLASRTQAEDTDVRASKPHIGLNAPTGVGVVGIMIGGIAVLRAKEGFRSGRCGW